MTERILVGDLIRPTARAADEQAARRARGRYALWGIHFAARRPALVVSLAEGERRGESRGGRIAYKLKSGVWREHPDGMAFSLFDFVARPDASAALNPFEIYRGTPTMRRVSLILNRKCFFILPRLGSPALIDPDGHFAFGDRTTPPAVIAQHVRRSLAEVHDYNDRFVDGRFSMEFLFPLEERSKAAFSAARDEIIARYGFTPKTFLERSASIEIRQCHDCFRLLPMTRNGGAQCEEAWSYVALTATDEEFGRAMLAMLMRTNVAIDAVRRSDPFLARVLPFLSPEWLASV